MAQVVDVLRCASKVGELQHSRQLRVALKVLLEHILDCLDVVVGGALNCLDLFEFKVNSKCKPFDSETGENARQQKAPPAGVVKCVRETHSSTPTHARFFFGPRYHISLQHTLSVVSTGSCE